MRECIERAVVSPPEPAEEGGTALEFRFGAGEAVFAGHFPQRAILPGVFQLEMARAAAERASGQAFAIARIQKAKFSRPIGPDETIRLEIRVTMEDGEIHARARLSVGGERAGESSLLLAPRAP